MKPDQSDQGPLRVDIIGAERRMLDGLQSAFSGRGHARYLIVNATIAEALIVDLSDSDAELLWQDYRREYPGRSTIVLSSTDREVPDGCVLHLKPLDLDKLFSSLETIRERLHDTQTFISAGSSDDRRLPEATTQTLQPEASERHYPARAEPSYRARLPDTAVLNLEATVAEPCAPKSTTESTAILEDIRPGDGLSSIDLMGDDPDRSNVELATDKRLCMATSNHLLSNFQAALKAAVITRAAAGLEYQDYRLIIDPCRDLVFHQPGTLTLTNLCRNVVGTNQVLISVAECPDGDATDWQVESVTATLWRMALWTYRGRLPLQTDIQSRMYLAHWPNFTRLLSLPNALRIAALWTEQPMPMSFTAQALRIPQRNVFAFYSAAYTIGLSGQARRESDQLFQPGELSH